MPLCATEAESKRSSSSMLKFPLFFASIDIWRIETIRRDRKVTLTLFLLVNLRSMIHPY